jgi:hypothetical protein
MFSSIPAIDRCGTIRADAAPTQTSPARQPATIENGISG